MMHRYRKMPVEIEAWQFTKANEPEVMAWCGGKQHGPYMAINTLEGQMIADYGDYIIKGIKGEFYPCKEDIFDKTYERVF